MYKRIVYSRTNRGRKRENSFEGETPVIGKGKRGENVEKREERRRERKRGKEKGFRRQFRVSSGPDATS